MRLCRIITTILFVATATCAGYAQTDSILVSNKDTIRYKYTPIDIPEEILLAVSGITTETTKNTQAQTKGAGLRKFIDYVTASVTDESFEKKIDFSFLISPYYSNVTSFGLAAVARGWYRLDRHNRALPPSSITISAGGSIRGMYDVRVVNDNIFKGGKNRLTVNVGFCSMPTRFWGVGYETAVSNAYVEYVANRQQADVAYLRRIAKNIYIGMQLDFVYDFCGRDTGVNIIDRLDGERTSYLSTGVSLLAMYDSRNSSTSPTKGLYISLKGTMRPKPLGNIGTTLWRVTATADYFQRLWRGAVLAIDLYGEFNSRNTPWTLCARVGDTHRMRGYYEGRFIDRNLVLAQAELRQNLWQRLGIAVWGGAGNVFGSVKDFAWRHTLPTYGVGLRWSIKNGATLRLDYGFGKRINGALTNGLIFSINESF